MNRQQRQQSRPYERRVSRGGSSHARRRRVPRTRDVGTWCAQVGVTSYSWSAHGDWREEEATLRGQPEEVPDVFRGVTMEDRFPVLPQQTLTEEERRNQCVLCGVPELHRQTHRLGGLHATREMAARYIERQGLRPQTLEEALRIIRSERPELLRQPDEQLPQDGGEPDMNLLMGGI